MSRLSTSDVDYLPVIHDRCSQTAFYVRTDVDPKPDTLVRPDQFILNTGERPVSYDVMRCGYCLHSLHGKSPLYRDGEQWRARA